MNQRCTSKDADYGVHRPEQRPRGSLTATCRYCGKDIQRAHHRSTWWRDAEPRAPEVFPRADDPGEGPE